jgi:hypothetical protein
VEVAGEAVREAGLARRDLDRSRERGVREREARVDLGRDLPDRPRPEGHGEALRRHVQLGGGAALVPPRPAARDRAPAAERRREVLEHQRSLLARDPQLDVAQRGDAAQVDPGRPDGEPSRERRLRGPAEREGAGREGLPQRSHLRQRLEEREPRVPRVDVRAPRPVGRHAEARRELSGVRAAHVEAGGGEPVREPRRERDVAGVGVADPEAPRARLHLAARRAQRAAEVGLERQRVRDHVEGRQADRPRRDVHGRDERRLAGALEQLRERAPDLRAPLQLGRPVEAREEARAHPLGVRVDGHVAGDGRQGREVRVIDHQLGDAHLSHHGRRGDLAAPAERPGDGAAEPDRQAQEVGDAREVQLGDGERGLELGGDERAGRPQRSPARRAQLDRDGRRGEGREHHLAARGGAGGARVELERRLDALVAELEPHLAVELGAPRRPPERQPRREGARPQRLGDEALKRREREVVEAHLHEHRRLAGHAGARRVGV